MTNKRLFKEAKKHLVGGVNSPVRSFKYVGIDPILIKSGKGSKVYDYNGNKYIDYVLSWGASMLGHAHPKVLEQLTRTIKLGLGFGVTNRLEIELAKKIKEAIYFVDKIRFVNSGTEAVMAAVRLARAYTKKDKILKFENSYHGSADYLLLRAGSGLATLGIPLSSGAPKDFIKHTIVAKSGDKKSLEKIFRKYSNEIACVLIEPVGGNNGVILPDVNFLKFLRKITKKYNSVLIFDEVITGFRFGFKSAAELFGIEPDLICLGKIIGGGLPVGAFGGSGKIMKLLAPEGNVYQAGTFSGNPIVVQAGLATLKILEKNKDKYKKLFALTEFLSRSIQKEAVSRNINLKINYFGPMFSFKFADKNHFEIIYRDLLKNGVFFAPSEFEANFLSFAHNQNDIEETIRVFKQALDKLGEWL